MPRKVRRFVPVVAGGRVEIVGRKVSDHVINFREKRLLSAGYLPEELTLLDSDSYEVGLLSLTVKTMKASNILGGRRNHLRHLMNRYPLSSRREAQALAMRDVMEDGDYTIAARNYIAYYYERYR